MKLIEGKLYRVHIPEPDAPGSHNFIMLDKYPDPSSHGRTAPNGEIFMFLREEKERSTGTTYEGKWYVLLDLFGKIHLFGGAAERFVKVEDSAPA
jgi:hypothetical protein